MLSPTVLLTALVLTAGEPGGSSDVASGSANENVAVSAEAVASAPPTIERSVFRLRFDAYSDGIGTAVGAAAWVTTEAISKRVLAPVACRLCDRDPEGADRLNALDGFGRQLRWSLEDQHTADLLSNVVGFGVLPLSVVGIDLFLAHQSGILRHAPEDLVIIAQSVVLALLFNQAVKFIAGRERPFVHQLSASERGGTKDPFDNNLSFFSGHSTFALSMAVATGVVATLRNYDHRWAVWAATMPLALGTVYLRMAADKHYATDVLVGMAVGTTFGIGIPLLFHPREGRFGEAVSALDVDLVPGPNGAALVGRF